jgi:hypothetical protein
VADDKLIFDILTGQNTLSKDLNSVKTSVASVEKNIGGLKNSFSSASKAASGIGAAFSALTGPVGIALVAIGSVVATLNKVTSAASEQEDAVNRLNIALKASGDFSEEATKELQDYASELQKVSRVGDEVTLSNLALLKSLAPLTNEGLKQANTAAVNLSAALRIDLDSAIRLIGKAANGNVEAFKRYGIELQKGKTDAETFSNALDVINGRFGNASQKDVETFSGAIAQTGNAFSDVLEEVGAFVTQSGELNSAIKSTGQFFSELAVSIKESREGNRQNTSVLEELHRQQVENNEVFEIINGTFAKNAGLVNDLAEANEELVRQNKLVADSLPEIFGASSADEFTASLSKASSAVGDTFKQAKKDGKDLLKNTGIDPAEFEKQAKEAVKKLEDAFKNVGQTQFEIIARETGERAVQIQKYVKDRKKADELISLNAKKAIEDVAKAQKDVDDKRQKDLQEKIQIAAQTPFNLAFKDIEGIEIGDDIAQGIAAGLGSISSIFKGASGAADLISGAAGGLANAIAPGLGAVVSDVFSKLSAGPEAVKGFIDSFIQGVPLIIENIILAIPQIIQSFAENAGPLIQKLFEIIPEAINRFIERLPEVAVALINGAIKAGITFATQMPFIATKLAISFAAQAPMMAISFVNELIKETPRLISEMIKQLGQSVGGIFGGGGGGGIGGDLLSTATFGLSDIFGFADGGIVPGGAPFSDRVPALLTPGEQVIDRSLTEKLDRFLSSGNTGQAQNLTINISLGEEQLAKVLLNLNRNGFRTA